MEYAIWISALAAVAYAVITVFIARYALSAFHEAQKQTKELSGTRWSGYFLEFTKRYDEIWGRMPACVTDGDYKETDWFTNKEEYIKNRFGETLGPVTAPDVSFGFDIPAHALHAQSKKLRTDFGQLLGQGYFSVDHGELLRLIDQYFNLCSEEFHISQKPGELDEEAWRIWQEGIVQNMRYNTLRAAWAKRRQQYKYYPDFKEWMDGVVVNASKDSSLQAKSE